MTLENKLIIEKDEVKRDDALRVVLRTITVNTFMNKYGLSRELTADYIRYYRNEIRQYNHLSYYYPD